MARSKKRKPSFDLPADSPTASAPVGNTGWVYRSDVVPKAAASEGGMATAAAAHEGPASGAAAGAHRAPPADTSVSVGARLVTWVTLPFEIAIMMALVLFQSKRSRPTAVSPQPAAGGRKNPDGAAQGRTGH